MIKFSCPPLSSLANPTTLRGGVLAIAIGSVTMGLLSLPSTEPVEIVEFTPPVEEQQWTSELPDFESITDVELKKKTFFSFLDSYIENENQHMLTNREALLAFAEIVEDGGELSANEQETFDAIAAEYRMQDSELPMAELIDELLVRADIIPVALALAQAANESGWGTSRFAREGNNLFGQWCFDEGCGLVPGQRADDKSHEVRAFASIEHAVKAYFRNLNSNPTYEYMRELRAQMRMLGQEIDPVVLASGLTRYSERGHVYVAELQSMIHTNDLLAREQESVAYSPTGG